MTRKDYQLIAEALRKAAPDTLHPSFPVLYSQWRHDTNKIMRALQADNPRFDAAKFHDHIFANLFEEDYK